MEELKNYLLKDIKALLDVSDNTNDKKLSIYLDMAIDEILSYCNYKEDNTVLDLNKNLLHAVKQLTIYKYNTRNKEHISSISQGARSTTYKTNTNGMPLEIENMCRPYRKIKVGGMECSMIIK